MKAGKLDRRIDLHRATTVPNAFNEPVETFASFATVWASATPISDGERARAGEVFSSISMRFQIRYSTTVSDLDTRDRVVFDGRVFDIVAVKEINRREGIEITASARAESP